jgi:hypothetical protein
MRATELEDEVACCDGRLCPSCFTMHGARSLRDVDWTAKVWLLMISLGGIGNLVGAAIVAGSAPVTVVSFCIVAIGLSVVGVLLSYDAVVAENKLQAVLMGILAVMEASYILYHAFINADSLGNNWLDERFVIIGVGAAPNLLQLLFLYHTVASMGYVAYKVAGALPVLQLQYDRFRSMLALIKVDIAASVTALVMATTLLKSDGFRPVELGLSLGAIALSFAFAWMGWLAAVLESGAMMIAFVVVSLAQPALMGWKLWLLWEEPEWFPPGVTIASFAVVVGVSLVLRSGLVVSGLLLWRGFGRGLKRVLADARQRHLAAKARHSKFTDAYNGSLEVASSLNRSGAKNGAALHPAHQLLLSHQDDDVLVLDRGT